MRILCVTWNYPPKLGGMEKLLAELIAHLRQQADVTVLAPAAATAVAEPDTVRVRYGGLLGFMLGALLGGWRRPSTQPYDVILGGSVLVAPIVYLLAKRHKRPFALIAHGLDLLYPAAPYQWMVRFFLPKARWVIANSSHTQALAVQRGVTAERVQVINPGIDGAVFKRPLSVPLPVDTTNHRVLLYAGRLAQRKGIAPFVRHAMPAILSACPDVLLLIVGDNPTDALAHHANVRQEVETAVVRHQMQDQVKLLGRVSDDVLKALYHRCDLFLLPVLHDPHDSEGFGIVLIEAAAAGKTAVATRTGGIPDAIADGQTGLLLPPGDWPQIAQAVIALLNDPQRRAAMGTAAQQRAQQFDWSQIAAQYRALFEQ